MKFNLNKKRIYYAASVLMIAIIIVGGIIYVIRKPESAAAWFDDSWYYRQAIILTNSSTAQTNTQVKVLVGFDASALVAAGKMQADLDDLRFADAAGNLIPYWIEDATNNSVDAWAFIPAMPASTTKTIYMYYGNTAAVNDELALGSVAYPGISCQAIKKSATTADGFYYIDPNGQEFTDKFQVYCDLTKSGGGWTLAQYSTQTSGSHPFTKASTPNYGTQTVLNLASADETMFTCKTNGTRENWYYILNQSVLNFVDSDSTDDNIGPLTVYNSDGHVNAYLQEDAVDEWSIGRTTWSAQTWGAVDGYSATRGPAKCEQHPVGTNLVYDGTALEGKYIYEIWLRESTISTTGHTITAGAPSTEEKGTAPIAYWRFDEGYSSTAYNSTSISGLNGALQSQASWATEDKCIAGKCIFMNDGGSTWQSIQVADNIALGSMSALTVGVWFKTVENKTRQQIIYKRNNGASPAWYSFQLYLDGLKPYFAVVNTSGTTGAALAANDIELNKWYHLVGVYDGSQVQIYVNAVAADSTPGSLTGNVLDSDYYLMIGGLDTPDSFFVHGFIDDVKIYDYARTIAQIRQDYNNTRSGTSTDLAANVAMGANNQRWISDGLIGYWKMDESSWVNDCSTATVLDDSGNANAGKSCPATTGPTSGTAGKYGNGGTFDGINDRVTTSVTTQFTDFTVAFWFKDNGSVTTYERLVDKSYSGGFWLGRNNAAANSWGGGILEGSAPYGIFGTFTDGQWNHMVSLRRGTIHELYANGILVASNTVSAAVLDSTAIEFGNGTTNQAGGVSMDEIRIYNRALSGVEVAKLYEWAPGPVNWWKMDDNSGTTTYDSSGTNYSGTLTSGPTWGVGKSGGAIKFDGTDDYVNISSYNGQSFFSAGTISFWLNLDRWSNYDNVFGTATANVNALRLEHDTSSDRLRFITGDASGNYSDLYSTTSFTTGSWRYVTFVWDQVANTKKLYLNGVYNNSVSGGYWPTTWPFLKLGTGFSGRFMQGRLDDFKIYNYARTPKQIMEDMNTGSLTPIAYWNFDEGQGTTVTNQVIDGPTGTISGATWNTTGKYGGALSFNGTHTVTVSNSSGRYSFPTSDFSLSAWFKPTSWSDHQRIFISEGFLYGFKVDNNHKLVATVNNVWTAAGNTTLNLNEWYHVVLVYDNVVDNLKMYVNGKQDLSSSSTAFGTMSPNNIYIGSYGGFGTTSIIDEPKIYNYALTTDDVKKDYNQGGAVRTGGNVEAGNTGSAPIAWWRLDDNTGTTAVDATGNGNTATFSGAPLWKAGKNGPALKFDGVDDYLTASQDLMDGACQGSISLWLKRGAWTESYTTFLTKSSGGSWVNNHIQISRDNATDNISLTISDNASSTTNNVTVGTINADTWYFVEMTWDGTTLKGYLNGVLQDSYNTTICVASDSTLFALGKGAVGTSRYLNGYIDDVKVYNYARTQAQVSYDYNRGKPVGYWTLDEGDGLVAKDSSYNNNSGTLTNSPTWSTSCKYGNCLSFNGSSSYISINDSLSLRPSSLTIGAWVKTASTSQTGCLVAKQLSTSSNNSYALYVNAGKTTMCVGPSAGSCTGSSDPNNLDNDIWSYYTGVFDGSNTYLYKNGKLLDSDSRVITIGYDTNPVYIGADSNDATTMPDACYFNGSLDDVRVYNYALTAEQVKQAMIQGGGARY